MNPPDSVRVHVVPRDENNLPNNLLLKSQIIASRFARAVKGEDKICTQMRDIEPHGLQFLLYSVFPAFLLFFNLLAGHPTYLVLRLVDLAFKFGLSRSLLL